MSSNCDADARTEVCLVAFAAIRVLFCVVFAFSPGPAFTGQDSKSQDSAASFRSDEAKPADNHSASTR